MRWVATILDSAAKHDPCAEGPRPAAEKKDGVPADGCHALLVATKVRHPERCGPWNFADVATEAVTCLHTLKWLGVTADANSNEPLVLTGVDPFRGPVLVVGGLVTAVGLLGQLFGVEAIDPDKKEKLRDKERREQRPVHLMSSPKTGPVGVGNA
jgi:hypothetical protein